MMLFIIWAGLLPSVVWSLSSKEDATFNIGQRTGAVFSPNDTALCGSTGCPEYTYKELWDLQSHFWDRFIYPANLEEAQSINSTLFVEDVQGRVDITRNFNGQELNTEYLFGLFTDPNSVTLVNTPTSYKIMHFAANDYITAASTIVNFKSTLLDTELPITIDTFIAWNDEGRIIQYDATFKWFNYLLNTFVALAAQKFGASSPAEAVALISSTLTKSICQIHATHCTSGNQQYKDNNACVQFLTEDIRFGQDYELGQNTLLCRSVHQQMVQYRPEVHCPHIGPSGGGMCVDDITYKEKVLENPFTHMPFVVKP